jgi:N-acetylneuraminic acid mutarotase
MPATIYDARAAYAANVNKVYVFGGFNGSIVVDTTYIYNVATNTWTTDAAMPAARIWPEAVYYSGNGKIYVIGGLDSGFVEQSQTWEYDPVTNTWNTSRAAAPVGEGSSNSAISGQFIYLTVVSAVMR